MKPEFRAWDSRNNKCNKPKMLNWEQIKHNSSMHFFGGYFEVFNREDFIIMQYTGLKDEHGKKIFEGDILKKILKQKISYARKAPHNYHIVLFSSGAYVAETYNGDIKVYPLLRDIGCYHFEIIGNIHEHAHLLETNQ